MKATRHKIKYLGNGLKHEIFRYASGEIEEEHYWLHDWRHRTDGPAYIDYYPSGQLKCQSYYVDGKRHRNNGPSLIIYLESGRLKEEEYCQNNNLHRIDGPAFIEYDDDGKVKDESYYLNNNEWRIEHFVNTMRQSNNKTKSLIEILNLEYKSKKELLLILSSMFRSEINQSVLDNLGIFF